MRIHAVKALGSFQANAIDIEACGARCNYGRIRRSKPKLQSLKPPHNQKFKRAHNDAEAG